MPIVSMRQLLDHAAENGYGLPAFNVNNMEQVWAIMEAAAEVDAPVIMQASAGARKYAGEPMVYVPLISHLEDEAPRTAPLVHEAELAQFLRAAQLGKPEEAGTARREDPRAVARRGKGSHPRCPASRLPDCRARREGRRPDHAETCPQA